MNEISPAATVSPLSDIEHSSRGSSLRISDGVMIDAFVKIKFAGGLGDIFIGSNSFINSGCVLYSGNGITIGQNVLLAANCTLAPVNHAYKERGITISKQGFMESRGGIIIEDDVWIGAGSVILDGAHIRRGSVIGAGSIVSLTTEEYGVYAGNPLVLKKYRS